MSQSRRFSWTLVFSLVVSWAVFGDLETRVAKMNPMGLNMEPGISHKRRLRDPRGTQKGPICLIQILLLIRLLLLLLLLILLHTVSYI